MVPSYTITGALCAVFAVGCAHAPRAASSAPAGADYTFAVTPGGVEVALAFAGAADGRTTLAMVKSWGGIDHPADGVRDLVVRGSDGAALPVTRAGDEWSVTHAPGAPLRVRYRLTMARPLDDDSSTYYRPVITPHVVHLIGETSLVYPRHLDDDTKRPFTIAWQLPDGNWRAVSSLGAGDQRATVELAYLRNAVFIASDELHLLTQHVGDRDVTVGAVGSWPHLDKMSELVARIVGVERRFFSDSGPPFFLVSLLPLPGDHCSSRGGTGLTRSFALFVSQPCPVDGSEEWLPTMLGHELFHGWNPRTDGEPEGLSYWFTEGFTDFYARRLLLRAGVLPLDGYVASLNAQLRAAVMSPARDASNQRIHDEFWRSHDVEKVPYWRGDLVALTVDAALRARGRSLDALYGKLVRESQAGAVLDTQKLLARIATETDAALAERLRRTIVDGAPLAIDPAMLRPCLDGAVVALPSYDLGLDAAALIERRQIRGVRPGSNAARAGLYDGAVLAGLSLTVGDPDSEVEVRVREKDTVRTIRYRPQGPPRDVVQFRPGDARACAGIL